MCKLFEIQNVKKKFKKMVHCIRVFYCDIEFYWFFNFILFYRKANLHPVKVSVESHFFPTKFNEQRRQSRETKSVVKVHKNPAHVL